MDACLKIDNLSKSYQSLPVLDHWNLTVARGERVIILGPSGCGKTTFLRIVAGLEKAGSGSIQHDESLKIGFVFQESRLIPWRSVKDNLKFVDEKGNGEILSQLGLDGFENYFPSQLSGGMKQRVNLARALITHPDLLILDEAFHSLDLGVKLKIINDINRLWSDKKFTLLAVTHDPREALLLADRIIILSKRPSKIVEEIIIPLGNNRQMSSPESFELETQLIQLISEESDGSAC